MNFVGLDLAVEVADLCLLDALLEDAVELGELGVEGGGGGGFEKGGEEV